MVFPLRLLLIFAVCCCGLACAADERNPGVEPASKRIALVIGNAAYGAAPLKNPVNDARAMTAKLEKLGFSVVKRENLTTRQIGATLREFRARLSPGAEALFFYAGHGLQVKGANYLPAVDADITSEEDVPNQSINVSQLLEIMDDTKTRLNLVFLDACRNNPFTRRFRSAGGGLAKIEAPSGTKISFATRPGSVAADGEGSNGLYTEHLLRVMDERGLPIEQALKKVYSGVKQASKGAQEPWEEGTIEGEFYFQSAQGTQVAQLGGGGGLGGGRSAAQIEDELWDAIKDGEKASVFEEYLKQYPKGRYLAQARVKIARLKAEARQPAPAAAPSAPTPAAAGSDPETALWSEVQKGNTADDYDVYLKQYPKGKYVALARQRLQKLKDEVRQQAEAAEQDAWQAAESAQTPEGYAAYLGRYPNGRYAALAQTRANKLKADAVVLEESRLWQAAEKGGKAEVDAYLGRYPKGRYAAAAQLKLAQITARAAQEERKAREEAARAPQWAESDNGSDITWDEAKAYCASKGSGWRLPSVAELERSYGLGHSTPCGSFTCKVSSNSRLTGPWFWSNEPKGSSEAWYVILHVGSRNFNEVWTRNGLRALCVRRP